MEIEEITEALFREVVRTPTTGEAENGALQALRKEVERQLKRRGLGAHTFLGLRNHSAQKWAGIVNDDGPRENFQIHACKWSDIGKGKAPPRLRYRVGEIHKKKDSAGLLSEAPGDTRTAYPDNGQLNGLVNEYFYHLFRANQAPLRDAATLLDGIDETFRMHRVVLSIDFYYMRPLTQLGLHKDTNGTTLLVGLHYDNEEDLLGPEYIYDFWPKTREDERYFSPWVIDRLVSQRYWPEHLIAGLELARSALKKRQAGSSDLVHAVTMGRMGLVSFVDELIFHQTPLTRKRTGDDADQFRSVSINGTYYEIPTLASNHRRHAGGVQRLRRQFSEENLEFEAAGPTGRRSFVRFWVMVEPKGWHIGLARGSPARVAVVVSAERGGARNVSLRQPSRG